MMVWWKLVQLQTSAGKLRRLLKECEKLCETAGAKTPSSELALRAASSNNQLLGIDLGPKLSAVTLAKLWDDFSKHYPAEVLCGDVRPCRALVQSIYVQKSHNELKFIPWKHITSEVQADREKQTSQKKEKKLGGRSGGLAGVRTSFRFSVCCPEAGFARPNHTRGGNSRCESVPAAGL